MLRNLQKLWVCVVEKPLIVNALVELKVINKPSQINSFLTGHIGSDTQYQRAIDIIQRLILKQNLNLWENA